MYICLPAFPTFFMVPFFFRKNDKKSKIFILMVKIKDNNHHLAIAIKKNYSAGMKAKDIAKLFKISKQRVNYWIHNSIKIRKRRTKLTRNEINMLVKWAKDKPIMEKKVS